ncbi:diacylglycerol kinase family protein [uncultured Nocardioides sp.]|uniref:diacylglycerol/lipid kinase family protein n=1 Tax=uncultured Nocardioides sp. TaxID=198441 RepID=UPI0025F7EC84|nr:diacylglycerol kinase family protein [uncultured Nocardioides sp.]
MRRSFTFLVNPASGGGAAPEAVVPVARLLRDAGAEVEVTYSPGPHAMRSLAAKAVVRGDVVVSVGGDGMLSSLAGEVGELGGTLGIVPAGRGNDFARMLGLPGTPSGLAEVLLTGAPRTVDLLCVGDRLVVGSVYAGVDARAAAIVDRATRVPRVLQYPLAAVRALATYTPARYRLDLDGAVREHVAATVVVANSAYYGKGMRIAPDADVDDGLLDVVVIEAASRVALVRALPSVYDGSHVLRPEVTVLRGRRVEVSAAGRDPVPVGADGEPLGALPALRDAPLVVEVRPGALSVLVPGPV